MINRRRTAPVQPVAAEHVAYQPIGIEDARIVDGPWADWQRANRDITTPHSFHWLESDGTVDSFRRLSPDVDEPAERRGLWFSDSDLYKALEGVAWDLGRAPSPELSTLLEEMTDIIAAAQESDGYLNTFVQAGLDERWVNLSHSHELYCIGHLIQAGIAHRRSTGRTELFDVAVRAADAAVQAFGGLRRKDTDGHEEIEMALVELYRETGTVEYLDLAQQLVDVRGHGILDPKGHFDNAYYQDATPVREASTVVGHAVRATYLLAGVVDLHMETGERALLDAALRQWESMTATQTYLNGALGSRYDGEAFGDSFELPPDLVYGETCASIGNIMLSWRLLLTTGESRFADAIERALYNLFSASTSVERTAFFYNNPAQRRTALPASPTDTRPVRADAPGTRPVWFQCACCPPNIMRTIASLGAYVATSTERGAQLHQYLPSALTLPVAGGTVRLDVTTAYPVDGHVVITVGATPEASWSLGLRRPDWAESPTLTVNGEPVTTVVNGLGYLEIDRAWTEGDVVVLTLPVEPRLTVAHPSVDAVRGTVAIERGPVVYAFENIDQESGVDLNHIEILVDRPLVEEARHDFLGQGHHRPTVIVHATGLARDDAPWGGRGWTTLGTEPRPVGREVELVAIPYALWANRGPSVMRIFAPVHRPGE